MAESILDFSKELDVALLDQVVMTFFGGSGQEQQLAQQLLTQFQDHEEAWTRVDGILERSNVPQTKFIALQILEKFIQTRWNTLNADSRNAIRYFIVNVIVKVSSDEQSLVKERTYINKLNMVLVQILKQEWPRNWPQFIPEILASSQTNLALCENNMAILKLLSEEIFDYSAEQMTQSKTSNLRNQMCGEFSDIYQLCTQVLEKATKPSLIKATLETLLRFLSWVPLGYVFETDLIDTLRSRFFEVPQFRNITLKCLTEIGSLNVDNQYGDKLVSLFTNVMTAINTMIPPNTDIADVYENSSDDDQEFVQNLAIFLTSFLTAHVKIIEQSPANHGLLVNAHYYLVKVSRVEDREVFKICLEYWAQLVQELFEEVRAMPPMESPLLDLSVPGGGPLGNAGYRPRKVLYVDVLSNLRVVMIERMVKPEEVLVVENDEGEIVREFVKESDTIVLYKSMKEVLVYLTNLDVADTEEIMTTKLAKQMDGSEWSWQNLNKLCWAIGSISGAMNEDTEKRFLVTVIKELLSLCEMKRGKDNKAVVASNIMYTVGQYPRFLKAHWKFLKTVVNKLFEFMHESHEGVQDMACDTFIKIAQKCKRHFVVQQTGEVRPFIDEILESIDRITSDLVPQQIHTFYEAVGYMISAQSNKPAQERLMENYMALPNTAWNVIMSEANQNVNVLDNANEIKILANVLKTNVAGCRSVGPAFIIQLSKIYAELLTLYRYVGKLVSQNVAEQGVIATKTPKVRGLRTIKKEILKLIDCYVECAEDLDAVNNNMVGPFFEAVLSDYNSSIDIARDAEVLNVLATVVNKLGSLMTPRVPAILEATFETTLNMITKDFAEFPEHRTGFYNLLRAINQQCFPALLELAPGQFKLIIDSIVWGFKHTMRDIADIGLQICKELIDNISRTDPSIAGAFYQSYYLSILQDIFFVLTDRDHKSGFKGQTEILAQLFHLVSSNQIQVPLYEPSQVSDPNMSNVQFLEGYVSALLQNAFPHLQSVQINYFVSAMLRYNSQPAKFKLEVRDFLIQLKEFAGENAELYLEEKEAELEAMRKAEREKALSVPGMLKPSEMDEDEDL
ncbi:nuclear export factor CRM1 [Radiomyces spectabilis]|uniref:nuclear export factor CRM1 n=1 Tax=Radiomyces spectabilis TaxID=64574 RepID=UPI00221ED548|nr:nuclear export factor CRM1 [Radiomyces spectabilis]KAI8365384.1 nuclear export factor CRM1 [Radiomyces spectabilis]